MNSRAPIRPNASSGSAALVLGQGAIFDGAAFASWLEAQPDLSPRWQPRYLRVADALPLTATNKVLVRELVWQKFRSELVGGDRIYCRPKGAAACRRFTSEDERALRLAFEASGRLRFWEV